MADALQYLLSRGRQAEAVAAVHGIAYANHRKTWLTEEILNEVGGESTIHAKTELSTKAVIMRKAGKFSTDRVGPLFKGKKLAASSTFCWAIWLPSQGSELTRRSDIDLVLLVNHWYGISVV